MKRVHRTDRISAVVVAGGLVRAVARKVGVLPYKRSDGSTVREYHPPETLDGASLIGRLVLVGHPASGLVTPATVGVGTVESASRESSTLAVQLRITDAGARARIDARELVEISAGYQCTLDATPGVTPAGEKYDAVQRNVTFDHLALLPRGAGRCGPTCSVRKDAACEIHGDAMDPDETPTETPDQMAVCAEKLTKIEAMCAACMALCTAIAAKLGIEPAKPDAPAGDAPPPPAPAKTDAAELTTEALVDARIKLLEQARRVLGTSTRLDGKPAHEIRTLALTKLDGASSFEGRDEREVAALFDGRMLAFSASQTAGGLRTDALGLPARVELASEPSIADKWRIRE